MSREAKVRPARSSTLLVRAAPATKERLSPLLGTPGGWPATLRFFQLLASDQRLLAPSPVHWKVESRVRSSRASSTGRMGERPGRCARPLTDGEWPCFFL